MKTLKTLFAVLIFVPLALGDSRSLMAADAGLFKLRFTQSGSTSASWPLYVAEQKKMFEKNGLHVEVIIIRGTPNVVRAVLSETIPIGRINPDVVINAMEKGGPVKIVAANMDKVPYDIFARQEIKTGADIKGKTLGVSTLSSGTTLMVNEVLEKAYKLKEGDYKLLIVGTSPDRYAALRGGSVHATFMGPPFTFRAAKDGFRKLANFHEHLGPILFNIDFVHVNFLKSNRNELVRFLKATIESTRWLYDPKNKEESLAIHMKFLKSTRESAEEDYQYLVQDFQPFPRDASISKVSFDKTMDLRAKEGIYQGRKIPSSSEFVDNSLIQEALKQLGK